jgi:hypothetical protein
MNTLSSRIGIRFWIFSLVAATLSGIGGSAIADNQALGQAVHHVSAGGQGRSYRMPNGKYQNTVTAEILGIREVAEGNIIDVAVNFEGRGFAGILVKSSYKTQIHSAVVDPKNSLRVVITAYLDTDRAFFSTNAAKPTQVNVGVTYAEPILFTASGQ